MVSNRRVLDQELDSACRYERNLGSDCVALFEMLCYQYIAAIVENCVVGFGGVLVAVDVYECNVEIHAGECC